jgi:hypothetical protein
MIISSIYLRPVSTLCSLNFNEVSSMSMFCRYLGLGRFHYDATHTDILSG